MKRRGAIKTDLFADQHHKQTIDKLGDPLSEIASWIDFAALAYEVDRIAPRPVSPQGGRPPFPTETMVRILILKRLYNLSDEQMEYQLLDRMSYQRFCGLTQAINIPDRTTVWVFENRIGEAGAKALFDGVSAQLVKKGFIARGGQIIDATLVPAPRQHLTRDDKEQNSGFGFTLCKYSLEIIGYSSCPCVECGFAENADFVGAVNILERGMQILSSDKNRGIHGDRLPSEPPSPGPSYKHGHGRSATGTNPIKPIPAWSGNHRPSGRGGCQDLLVIFLINALWIRYVSFKRLPKDHKKTKFSPL